MPKIFQRGKSKTWYVRLRKGGQDRWISLRTTKKKEAETRAGRLLYSQLPEVIQVVSDPPSLLISDIVVEYAKSGHYRGLKESTMDTHLGIISKFTKWCRERDLKDSGRIQRDIAREYIDGLNRSPKTCNNHKQVLSTVWRVLELSDPWAKVSNQKLATVPYRAFTDEELKVILNYCNDHSRDFWYAATMIGVYTALRMKDIVHLRWSDFGPELRYIELKPAKTERTGRKVYIPIHSDLKDVLCAVSYREGEYLFPTAVESYAGNKSFSKQFKRILDNCDISAGPGQKIGFHSLRDTFATRARTSGMPLDEIRAIMGHRTKEMTAHYIDSPDALSVDQYPSVHS